jgi:aspartokinase/homoserine dehydrogenase 1
MSSSVVVHKFGGTSLATPEHYGRVAELLLARSSPQAIVVSAMAGVTDDLLRLLELARTASPLLEQRLEGLVARHRDAITALINGPEQKALIEALNKDAKDVADVLHGVRLLRSSSETTSDFISGHGEVWSARLLSAVLRARGASSRFVDARDVLVVEAEGTGLKVHWEASEKRFEPERPQGEERIVITGYVCRAPDGTPATLKRNGSDYSASIFASLTDAREVTIWTDVPGVLTADPRRVPEAVVVPALSYAEAMELAYFGAKVLHPSTMGPAVAKNIPIFIKSTLEPDASGTRIGPPDDEVAALTDAAHAVRGFASIEDVALLNVEGNGMIGVPGVAQRVFGSLKEVGVSVILIAQASSEHSICFAVPDAQGELAKRTLEDSFIGEMQRGQIESVDLSARCAILAAVGDRMAETPGVTGKLAGALGRAGVNIRAVAQGSSERNISVVVDQADATRGLRAAHAGFYLSEQTVSVGLVGPGLIGAELLEQLERQAATLRDDFHIDLRVRGILRSSTMVLDDGGLDLGAWRDRLEGGEESELSRFTEHVQTSHLPHSVIIDCTAADLGDWYERWLDRGIHVLTPNKKASSGDLDRFKRIRRAARRQGAHYFYEATVGAGLPVVSTLRDLLQTGDRVHRIEGVFSGTLSYLFNTLAPGEKFSELVSGAKERGYTEPDPRDDLSGMDVARKVIILARESGLELELDDVPVESLVPASLPDDLDVDGFMARLGEGDEDMATKLGAADERGEVLRYVGVVDVLEKKARVELRPYAKSHAFARLNGSDNIIAFTTDRYKDQPLIVQGPGAGPAVTAGGVFADLLRLAAHLGAPS